MNSYSFFLSVVAWFLTLVIPPLYARNNRNKKQRIVYRQARHLDLGKILALYDDISEDDASKIVMLPHPYRRMAFKEAIRKGQIFIAQDPYYYDRSLRKHRPIIVSVLKTYLIDDTDELRNKLINEIRSLEEKAPYAPQDPYESGCYLIPFDKTLDFKGKRHINLQDAPQPDTPPQAPSTPVSMVIPRVLRAREAYAFNRKQTHIYYGGAFTVPCYRGLGINTKLQVYALNFILDEVIHHIKTNNSKHLRLLYGQVEANTMSIGSVRVFADYINLINLSLRKNIPQQHIRINYYGYISYRPVFTFKNSALVQLPDDDPEVQEGEGLGKILCYEIPPFAGDDESDAESVNDTEYDT